MKRTPCTVFVALAFALGCKRPAPPATPAPPVPTPTVSASATDGGAPPAMTADPPAPAEAFRGTARFLPRSSPVPGWSQSGGVQVVAGRELYQLIDGAAAKYVAYGFHELGRTDYRKAGTELVVTAEVYDMGSTLGAFGQFSMMLSDSRDPFTMRDHAVDQGSGGFLGTSQLVFWKERYLVQLNLADDGGGDEVSLRATASSVLPALAAAIATMLPATGAAPAPPTTLPLEGLVWGGMTYLADDVLGVSQSGAAWVGHYNSEGHRYRVAHFGRGAATEAGALFRRLRGAGATSIAGLGDEAFSSATLCAARKGNVVLAVAEPEPATLPSLAPEARVQRLRALVATLP